MKYVSIRIPDPAPLGETLFDANVRAIVDAFFVNSPRGGCVESVVTFATHRFFLAEAFFPAGIPALDQSHAGARSGEKKCSCAGPIQ
jgi:hypothetical protein